MLKITDCASGEGVTLQLEGQIAGPWVHELRRAYCHRRRLNVPLTFDLTNVTFIDPGGIAFFEGVADEVRLVNCSLFAAEQLRSVLARQEAVR